MTMKKLIFLFVTCMLLMGCRSITYTRESTTSLNPANNLLGPAVTVSESFKAWSLGTALSIEEIDKSDQTGLKVKGYNHKGDSETVKAAIEAGVRAGIGGFRNNVVMPPPLQP